MHELLIGLAGVALLVGVFAWQRRLSEGASVRFNLMQIIGGTAALLFVLGATIRGLVLGAYWLLS
ncbi:hypothetical protein [Methylobacterium oxalidis]|nr:hypothetical protein [Methylobacterium oxalidis]GJE31305.1 hypothetical protein LDDCCGHA_1482 [Methylobacterium oxalidis]GLS66134.1 hypothetical protein GCM10007888_45160 [Methylobacterium oxalidis]